MAVSPDLLEILRCPYCVSGPTRKEGDDPGQLNLVGGDHWLACTEPDCGRKYPIKEDIPVMLIEEGDKWIDTPVDELPEPGPLVEPTTPSAVARPSDFGSSSSGYDQKRLALLLLSILGVSLLIAGLLYFWRPTDQT